MPIELVRIKRSDPRILADMATHYSQPKGFVGRNICYAYFDVWSYRNWVYPPGGGMGNCTHAIRCLEIGLFWWDLKLFWLAELSSEKSRSK